MSSLTFVTNPICPFAHRVWLTLEEIGLKYETKETPLTDKPAWFTEIYGKALGSDPTSDGKVPVLQDDDFILTESAVVAEYLAEKYGHSTGLLGKSAEDRARIRIFTEQFTGKFIPLWYGVIRAQDDESKAKATKDFLALTARISKVRADHRPVLPRQRGVPCRCAALPVDLPPPRAHPLSRL
eukprot:Opistho-2@66772